MHFSVPNLYFMFIFFFSFLKNMSKYCMYLYYFKCPSICKNCLYWLLQKIKARKMRRIIRPFSKYFLKPVFVLVNSFPRGNQLTSIYFTLIFLCYLKLTKLEEVEKRCLFFYWSHLLFQYSMWKRGFYFSFRGFIRKLFFCSQVKKQLKNSIHGKCF